ncbi:DUF397 domain-containing protein [Actinomadura napierensis]|uniref:DUF397 domain-containing protein n=1 Tax=Actinomadura napierensis TaxID=267854 RepID=A0ABP5KAS0_9ACTN
MFGDLACAVWRKSSRSAQADQHCVEVAGVAGAVAVRDSKDPDGPKLVFGVAAWRAFVRCAASSGLDC